VSFKIHYRKNLIDKKHSYLIPRPPSWDDRNCSYGHQLYPTAYGKINKSFFIETTQILMIIRWAIQNNVSPFVRRGDIIIPERILCVKTLLKHQWQRKVWTIHSFNLNKPPWKKKLSLYDWEIVIFIWLVLSIYIEDNRTCLQ
jgi:hypothetical protein